MSKIMDIKDEKILEMLVENSKLTTQQISQRTRIPITTVHNRIKRMEHEGIIRQYTVVLDKKKIGREITAYVSLSVNYSHEHARKFSQHDAAKRIRSIEGVDEVAIVAGGTDMIVKVSVASIEELNDFITRKLRNIEGIDKTQTMVVLDEVK